MSYSLQERLRALEAQSRQYSSSNSWDRPWTPSAYIPQSQSKLISPMRNAGVQPPNSYGGVNGGSVISTSYDGTRNDNGLSVSIDKGAGVDPTVANLIEKQLVYSPDLDDGVPAEGEVLDVPKQFTRRKVKKLIEVPVTQKVKVPTTSHQVVPETQRVKIKVKKQVPKEIIEEVEEAYSDVEEVPATRTREVWVKKLVPENYMKKVKVQRTRKVKVPKTIVEEVEEKVDVEVPVQKVVEVPSFRVDEVKRTKLVEVEGWQEVEMVPRIRDSKVWVESTKDVKLNKEIVNRKRGKEVLPADHHGLKSLEMDRD